MDRAERNERIGTVIGKTASYGVQMFTFYKIAEFTSPKVALVTKFGLRYGTKLVRYTTKTYRRTDFDDDTIFSEAIDASFNVD